MSELGFPLISVWPDEPTYHICRFNLSYLSEVLGAVSQYDDPDLWQGTEEQQAGMRARIWVLLEQINAPYNCPTGGDMLIGGIMWYPSDSVPSGWLACDGDAYSRSAYEDLFAVVGETFGEGDGETTFNVPDLQSRVVLGVGQGGGLTEYSVGGTGGEEAHQLTIAEMPAHTHTVNQGTADGSSTKARQGTPQGFATMNTGETGGDGSHENRQPYIALMPIIYSGVE